MKILLNELAEKCWDTANEKGWYDEPRSFGDAIALMHSELSEALEAYRKHGFISWYSPADFFDGPHKPEGVEYEFADTIIRLLDACHNFGINIQQAVDVKMEYNRTRPYRHGGKKL